MENNQIVNDIYRIMSHFFNNNEKRLEEWLDKSNFMLEDRWGQNRSPREMIESGDEQIVMNLINLTIYQK